VGHLTRARARGSFGLRYSPGPDRLTTGNVVSRGLKKDRTAYKAGQGSWSLPDPDTGPFALAYGSGTPGHRRKKKAVRVDGPLAFQVPPGATISARPLSSYVPFLLRPGEGMPVSLSSQVTADKKSPALCFEIVSSTVFRAPFCAFSQHRTRENLIRCALCPMASSGWFGQPFTRPWPRNLLVL